MPAKIHIVKQLPWQQIHVPHGYILFVISQAVGVTTTCFKAR